MDTKTPDQESAWIENYPAVYAELLREHGMPPTASEKYDEFNRELIGLYDQGLRDADLAHGADQLLENLFGDNRLYPDEADDEVVVDGDDIGD